MSQVIWVAGGMAILVVNWLWLAREDVRESRRKRRR